MWLAPHNRAISLSFTYDSEGLSEDITEQTEMTEQTEIFRRFFSG